MSIYSNIFIKKLNTAEEREDAIKIRLAVFVHEQKYSMEDEFDNYDDGAEHWAAYCDKKNQDGSVTNNVPVGTIRLIPQPNNLAKLGRLAVLDTARGLYIGQLLVKTFIQYSKDNDFKTIVLHAQYPRKGFYEKLGFVTEAGDDEIFLEDGTPHIRMWMRNL